jgi:hypothetical protein
VRWQDGYRGSLIAKFLNGGRRMFEVMPLLHSLIHHVVRYTRRLVLNSSHARLF